MAEITAAAVGKLREMTERGIDGLQKGADRSQRRPGRGRRHPPQEGRRHGRQKAGREAKEGVIAQYIHPGGTLGVLVEVNCETDFVARNETFRAFCDEVAQQTGRRSQARTSKPTASRQVAKIGENIKISRHHRLEVPATA